MQKRWYGISGKNGEGTDQLLEQIEKIHAKTEIIFRKAVWISGSRKDPVDPKSRTAFERRIQR